MPSAAMCMNLEIIILNEVSQKEKGKYYITHMWSLKHDTKGLIYKADTDLQILRTDLWFAKERQVRKG